MKTLSHATILGALALVAIVGLIVLGATGHPIPDVLSAIALAGVSALAGLAIPSGTGGSVLTTAEAPATVADADPDPQPAPAAAAPARTGYSRPVE